MAYEPAPAYVVLELAEHGRVLRIGGELDLESRESVEPTVLAAIEQGGPVTIDLGDLTFCDSTGIAVLLTAREKAATEAVSLTIRHARTSLQRVFALTGVDHVIDVCDEVTD